MSFLIELIRAYFILTFVYAVVSLIRMYRIRGYASDKKYGKARIEKLASEGRMRQVPIYSAGEMAENKHKAVVRLSVFPVDTEERSKVVIVCPGGGYMHLCTKDEGYPVAAKLNEMGYTAFVLEYRTGFDCSSHAPMHDLAMTVKHITERADEYNVDMKDYVVMGFSAGGNLAGIFGSRRWGWERYGVERPGAVILGYPWTNINHWLQHPYWNIWLGLAGIWLSEQGNIFMFGFWGHFKKVNRESLCVQNFITDDYPPVYMFVGGNDILVPAGSHADVLETALKEHNVPYKYDKFFGLPHGVGLGVKTRAEGWIDDAMKFAGEHMDN